jgi:sec-independent protein translocase protein TatA
MFLSLGFIDSPEQILLVLAIALLIFGPAKLPDLGRSLGRAIREFKQASADLQETIVRETEEIREAGLQKGPPQGRPPAGALPPPTIPMGSETPPPLAQDPVQPRLGPADGP